MDRALTLAIGLALLTTTVAVASAGEQDPETNRQLAEVREETAEYQDLDEAIEDGYTQFSVHVPQMGLHYLDNAAIGPDGTSDLDRSLERSNPEILLYVQDGDDGDERFLAVEYALPVADGDTAPPLQAVDLFDGADASDWHIHPSRHELGLDPGWTVHAECHYQGGLGVWLAEDPNGTFVQLSPEGQVGTWNGTVAPDQCPEETDGDPLPALLIVHEKWWTLHAWVWFDNPEGVFHPTNPRVSP